MSRESVLMAAIPSEPLSTSELYDRVGYPALARHGLIPYPAFRDALVQLERSGAIERHTAPDGSTMWHRVDETDPPGGRSAQ